MKKTVFLITFAALLLASMLFAQNNPPRINGVIWKPDGISLTYVEGNGTINGFFIGRFEITQAQWEAVMGDNPSKFKGDNLPVETVGWNDVQEFLKKLNEQTGRNYRLPTEAEWRYAASGGNISNGYKYAGSNNLDEVAWYIDNSGERSHPVGTKKPNELGIFDMCGNVLEWFMGSKGDYCYTGGNHSFPRFNTSKQLSLKYKSLSFRNPNIRGSEIGFRVVLSY